MRLEDSIAQGTAVRNNARGPVRSRRWQKMPPPQDPRVSPIAPPGGSGGRFGGSPVAAPVPVHAGFPLPQRPLPPVNVAVDPLQQFQKVTGVPTRRVFGPSPL